MSLKRDFVAGPDGASGGPGSGDGVEASKRPRHSGEDAVDEEGRDCMSPGPNPPAFASFGYVKRCMPERGMSFLITDPDDDTSTVYVHHSVCHPEQLAKAQAVAYQTHYNRKGEEQASAPIWLLMGPVEDNSLVSWCEHVGIVKKRPDSDDFIVDCEAVFKSYGDFALCDAEVVREGLLIEGDAIRFDVNVGKLGTPVVKLPLWKYHKGSGSAKGSGPGAGKGGVGGKGGQVAWRQEVRGEVPAPSEGEPIIGTVALLNTEKGFSFCDCQGWQVYINKKSVDPSILTAGDILAFSTRQNKPDVAPEAVRPIFKLVGRRPKDGEELSIGEHFGIVGKLLAGGSAFVQSPDVQAAFGNDPYLFSAVLQECGLQEGDTVAFRVHVNSRQQPQVSWPVWKMVSEEGNWSSSWVGGNGGWKGAGKGGKEWGPADAAPSGPRKENVEGGLPAAFAKLGNRSTWT